MAKVFNLKGKKVWVAGHNGMVGSAILRRLESEGCETITAERSIIDLTRQSEVEAWMAENKPDAVIVAAGKVGGIHANNTYPAEFLYDNLQIETNVIQSSYINNVEKLLFLGSSCIYPRNTSQPIKEESLLTGSLEPTNEWYSIAKIAGIKLCQSYRQQYGCDYISAMPTNIYGPGDNFHPENSHVPAALISRLHDAKKNNKETVTVWGTGQPIREFLHVDDLADASIFLMKEYSHSEHINVGTGNGITIKKFAELLKRIVVYNGELKYDFSREDGSPEKILDVLKLNKLGWKAKISLEEGLTSYYQWYIQNLSKLRV